MGCLTASAERTVSGTWASIVSAFLDISLSAPTSPPVHAFTFISTLLRHDIKKCLAANV